MGGYEPCIELPRTVDGDELAAVVEDAAEAFVADHGGYALDMEETGTRRYRVGSAKVKEDRERLDVSIHNRGWNRPYFWFTDAWGFGVGVETDETYTELPLETNPPTFTKERYGRQLVDWALSPVLGGPGDRFDEDIEAFIGYVRDAFESQSSPYAGSSSSGGW